MDYSIIISMMVWSFSRLTSFISCNYGWNLRYLDDTKKESNFYGEYGTFMHDLLAKFYNKEATKDEIILEYLLEFKTKISSKVKSKTFENSLIKYFDAGIKYLETFEPFVFKKLGGVEQKVEFEIDGYPFIGYIDLWGFCEDDEIEIIDHKSKDLKKRSTRKIPTKTDEQLDEYLKQLYLYCIPIYNLTGKYPARLKFNCFKADEIITENFDIKKLQEAKGWATIIIKMIEKEKTWSPTGDFIYCRDICNSRSSCEYMN